MLQIYALVVAINVIIGVIVLFDRMQGDGFEGDGSFIHNNTFALTLTIFAGIIAISSLMAPYGERTNGELPFAMLPILGDLLPALATFAGFFVFLTRYLKANHPTIYTDHSFFALVENSEFQIAVFCLIVATIHFFFPQVAFI